MGFWKTIIGHDDIMSVIKNTSDKSVVVFKHPNTEFNTRSRLILNESEVAVFVRTCDDGKTETITLDQGGVLHTNNIPFFRSITQILTGGVSKFSCSVYFVRTNLFINNGWGTEEPVGPLSDCRNYYFYLTANGTYSFEVTNARALLRNFTNHGVTSLTQEEIAVMINSTVSTLMGTSFGALFSFPEKTLGLTRMQEMMRKEADATFGRLMNDLWEKKWGIRFSGLTINLKDVYDGLAKHYLDLNDEIRKTETFDYQGESFTAIQLYDALKNMAENPQNISGSMMGVGMGAGVGTSMGSLIGNTIMSSNIGGGTTSGNTGSQTPPNRRNPGIPLQHAMQLEAEEKELRKARLRELKENFTEGLITEMEYEEMRREILQQMRQ